MIQNNENEIDLYKIFKILWNKKFFIVLITSLSALLGLFFSLYISNIYTSSALLAPSNSDNSMSSKLGSYSSLAGLAGINLPDEQASMSDEAIARIRSFEFFSTYFLPSIQLEDIFAVKRWDQRENKIIYDKKKYDESKKKWTRKVSHPKTLIPSDQEAYKIYTEILGISQNKKTSFVTLSIDHKSPYLAKEWVDIIINKINLSMRNEDNRRAEESISFLQEYSKSTNIQSIQDAISILLESQMQTLMLTTGNEFYVYKILNSPIVPEDESSPNRTLIFLFSVFFGLIVSILFTLFSHYYLSKNNTK